MLKMSVWFYGIVLPNALDEWLILFHHVGKVPVQIWTRKPSNVPYIYRFYSFLLTNAQVVS
jgi:hypothetical protein